MSRDTPSAALSAARATIIAMSSTLSPADRTGLAAAASAPEALAAPRADGGRRRRWSPDGPLDLAQSLGPLTRGERHTTARAESRDRVWITARVGDTPVTARFSRAGDLDPLRRDVVVDAWGAGAAAFLEEAPRWCGQDDDWRAFEDSASWSLLPEQLRRSRHDSPGLRLISTGRLYDALVSAVLEQRVTGHEAVREQRWLARAHGDPAPGPAPKGMAVLPAPERLRRIPSWSWHRAGVDPARSRTLQVVASRAAALARWDRRPPDEELERALASLPGVGPWTIAETLQVSHGDPDRISVLDYHLAHHVTEYFDGRRGDDARMLRILEPWKGHRQRVVRLLHGSSWSAQRRGPRLAPEDHRQR